MRSDTHNPSGNQLPPGLLETELINAIESSGYPLQGVVAGELKKHFDDVTEEWGYIDHDTKEHRSLDVFAHKYVSEDHPAEVQPGVILLIECKRSRHPYIFFRSTSPPSMHEFPFVAGLRNGEIYLREIDNNRGISASGAKVLGLDELPFVEPGPPVCASFTKAVPSGKKVELSGTDPYNSIVLPLAKAFDHASRLFKAAPSVSRIYPMLTLCIGVVDAPMLVVEAPDRASDPVLSPWVRIVRQEANTADSPWEWYRFYYADVVHAGFFGEYLQKHLIPFAQEFGKRVAELKKVFVHGANVKDVTNWTWEELRA